MADEQQAKPSFKHAIVKRALAPVVASVATAVTTYLMRKAVELWHESVQPKVEEKGGAEALARQAADAVSSKLGPASEAVTSQGGGDELDSQAEPDADADRSKERQQREQRRKQRRKALDQAKAT
jgi:hypothetical protein